MKTVLILQVSILVVCTDSFMAPTSWHFEGPNIAFGKQARQRPGTFSENNIHLKQYISYEAGLAVDGNTDPDFSHGHCSHTSVQSAFDATWTVDLRTSYYIYGIVIYNRKDENAKNRLANFLIYGQSRRGNNLLYNDRDENQYKKNVIYIPLDPPQGYQQITVLVPRHDSETILTLCEVQIFGDEHYACEKPFLQNGHLDIVSGDISRNRYSRGTTLSFYCSQGYILVGRRSLRCQWNGLFNESLPICVLACTVPSVQHGHFLKNNIGITAGQSIVVGETILLKCSRGFEVEGKSALRCIRGNYIDRTTADWDRTAVCKSVTCTYPLLQYGYYVKHNGMNYTTGNSTFRTEIHARCNSGYRLNHLNDERFCNEHGQWSGVEPTCVHISCNHPGNLSNGNYVTQNGSTYTTGDLYFGNIITAICIEGFRLNGGTRQCNDSGKWSGNAPVCDEVFCSYPGTIDNGIYITQNGKDLTNHLLSFGTTIQAKCNIGYKLKSNDIERSCDDNGQWIGETPVCGVIQCTLPDNISNAKFEKLNKSDVSDTLDFGSVIQWECIDSYHLGNGSEYQYCDVNGWWNGTTPICVPVMQDNTKPLPMTAVIGGATSGGLIILVVILIVFISKTRRSKARKKYADLKKTTRDGFAGSETEYSEINEIPETGSTPNPPHPVYQNPVFSGLDVAEAGQEYYSFSGQTKMPDRAILVARLSDVVLNGAVAKDLYAEQYESFSKSLPGNQTIGNKLENVKKNRYKNVFLYDDTRVVLKTSPSGSDYINASYIHGFGKVNTYIATQGPLKGTLQEFWRMIWQSESGKIVMLTNLVEQNKTKCEQYWPDRDATCYGDVHVRFDKADVFAEFTIRTFWVKKGKEKERLVKQFHFTTWPDKGVPKYASSLVNFWNKVRHVPTRSRGPIVVHCSAGVGRTGTFIALDYLVDQARALDYVDVAGCVETLRRQRPNLVQTLEQYIFVHHVLVEALMLSTSALPAAQFPGAYRQLLQINPNTGKRNLNSAFETLRKMSPVPEESQYVSAKEVRNKKKNRCPNILPVADYTPSLGGATSSSNEDYINAVFLPTYKEQRAFIVTQMPLQQTIPDFWRLIFQQEVHTVVMVNHIDQAEESEIYWPEGDELIEYANIKVKNIGSEMYSNHRVIRLEITYLKKTRIIQQFQFGDWFPDADLPSDTACMLRMIELVQAWQRQSGNHTILVHCMNGAERSGLYCVISAVLERMKVEQDVAISHVIEEMRNRREQIIPTEEQFQFCHETVLSFLEQNDTYSNFSA